jgi:putative transposase
MLELLIVIGRAVALALRGHQELVFENLALRQQLTAVTRTSRHLPLQSRDRLFWIALARVWRNRRTALVLVQPDTVVRWHRDWLRSRWTRRSKHRPSGRPTIDAQIRVLVREMATANPLWGAPRRQRPPSQTWKTFLTNHLALDFSHRTLGLPNADTCTGR